MMNIDEILEYLPHRYPFLLVDRVTEVEKGKSIKGYKNISFNESFFQGHFPNNPIMPGVLIVEAMAQTAACMVSVTLGGDTDDKLVFFTTIDKVKFRKPVRPGSVLKLHIEKVSAKGPLWKFKGFATVDDVRTSEAEFGAMIVDPQR